MQIYLVGGAVRDALLGLPVQDRDWVVVGATPEKMVAQGFLPVGKDFPVFLHPVTKEEYALARTERKTAPGYKGFVIHAAPDVTLEQDLARRDITINSIATYAEGTRATGTFDAPIDEKQASQPDLTRLIDPHGGQQDLRNKVLRHVTDAFREDPVRILRVARFAARFADFSVAPETMQLMREMVVHGEADHLVAERVWQELSRGLMAHKPSRMFEVLRECGALARLLPEIQWGSDSNAIAAQHAAATRVHRPMNLESGPHSMPRTNPPPEVDSGIHLLRVLDMSARLNASLPVRFACLCHALGPDTRPAGMLAKKSGAASKFVSTVARKEESARGAETTLEPDPNLSNLSNLDASPEERSAKLLKTICQRLRVPTECRELAEVVAREHGNIHRSGGFNAAALVRLLERCDAFRKPARFAEVLLACECLARGRLGREASAYPQRQRLLGALQAAQSVATEPIASNAIATGATGINVGEMIHAARVAAVAHHLAA